MSYSYSKRSYSTSAAKGSSPSQAIEDPKKKTSLLKDRSWIRSNADQDEAVDQDPNFGRVVLNKYRSNEALDSAETADLKSPQTTTSVEALKKRFGGSQDELSKGSTLPSTYGRSSTSYTRSTSPPKSDGLKTTTVSKTTVTEKPKKTSTTTTTTTKGGTTTETTISTSQSVSRSPVVKSPTTNTERFTDRVFSSRKGTEDQLVSSLIPTSVKTEYLIPDSTTSVSKTDTVTLKTTKKESTYGDGSKKPPTTPRGTSSKTEDDLFDTLLPTTIIARYSSPDSTTTITNKEVVTVDSPKGDVKTVKSPTSTTRTITSRSDDVSTTRSSSYTISSKPSEDYTSTNTRKSYSSKPDNSVTSTSVYTTSTTYKDSSRAEDDLFDSLMLKPTKTVYSTPERTVLERDLCSYCRKPMSSDPKMVLEDMKINCHTTCFKCEVCSSDLGHLKAGDSMWVYRRTVHCERCFEVTRGLPCDRDPSMGLPVQTKDAVINLKSVQEISRELGFEWTVLAYELGFSRTEVHQFHTTSTEKTVQARSMLECWYERSWDKSNKTKLLQDGLERAGRRDLAERLRCLHWGHQKLSRRVELPSAFPFLITVHRTIENRDGLRRINDLSRRFT